MPERSSPVRPAGIRAAVFSYLSDLRAAAAPAPMDEDLIATLIKGIALARG
jgi:hypothetical protein